MHSFTLTDGALSVELNDGTNVWTVSYSLATPDPGAGDCVDRLELLFLTTPDTTTMRKIERLLERAAARQKTRRGPKVYLEVEMDADTETWRAEVFQGGFAAESLIDDTYMGKTSATLLVQRAPFWEGAEAEIALRNYATMAAPDPATGGVTAPNDPEVGCWVHIDDDQVAGALPAPVRLRIENAEAGGQYYRFFVVGNNAFSLPLASLSVIQAEDETSGLGSDAASGVYSDGAQWTSESFVDTAELLGKWNLGTGLAQASEGKWWRLLARITNFTVGHGPVLWPVIYDASGLVVLWTGQEVRPTYGQLLDFGPVPLPPGPYDANYASVMLGLYGRATVATTVALDYFYLMPMDALRKVEQVALSVDSGDWVEFDEIEGRYYIETAALNARTAVHVPSEAPLVVFPGVAQRVHLLYRTTSAMTIGDEATVSMWYRPRRLTL